MYMLKVSCGDYDDIEGHDTETETTEILGTYKYRDDAARAAKDKFDEVMGWLDDIETRYYDIVEGRYRYYILYGYIELELGYADNEHYYDISVIEI